MKKLIGYINNFEEAALVMHAARLGFLELRTKRLSNDERDQIESGAIFCFIESESGLKRWTDGRIWSPSKICGEFLVYQEVPHYLSKNSIKKRHNDRRNDQEALRVPKRECIIDRTTMHKKTICIKNENNSYHIVAYFRPIFVNASLMDMPFFQKLSKALNLFPILKTNQYLAENLERERRFFEELQIEEESECVSIDNGKRALLEKIAVEVLGSLSKDMMRRKKQIESRYI